MIISVYHRRVKNIFVTIRCVNINVGKFDVIRPIKCKLFFLFVTVELL